MYRQNAVVTIHPDSQEEVQQTRERLSQQEVNRPRVRGSTDSQNSCPICLCDLSYAVDTNCGHTFCCSCIITYWRTGRWLGAVACPACRQTVTLLLHAFTGAEIDDASEEKQAVMDDIRDYNRRFSGEPRSFMEYIQDAPMLFRHALSALFSLDGMVFMFRLRILVCVLFVVLYILSPLDLIPEAVLGLFGYFDDIIILFLLAIYVTVMFRAMVTNGLNQHND